MDDCVPERVCRRRRRLRGTVSPCVAPPLIREPLPQQSLPLRLQVAGLLTGNDVGREVEIAAIPRAARLAPPELPALLVPVDLGSGIVLAPRTGRHAIALDVESQHNGDLEQVQLADLGNPARDLLAR